MPTDVEIINLGLGKLGQSQIFAIAPARSPLEIHCKAGWPVWSNTELAKHRWVFATIQRHPLALIGELAGEDRPYVYELPAWALRPWRTKYSEWVQVGRTIESAESGLRIDIIRETDTANFDPLFVDVLACRVAIECVEFKTQSNTKKADLREEYRETVNIAKKANAFVVGPEDIQADDNDFEFLRGRYGFA